MIASAVTPGCPAGRRRIVPFMTEPVQDLPLASEFPPATRQAWLSLVEGVLKGAAFEDRLVTRTHGSLKIEPLHARAAAARPVAGRAPALPWQVMQRIDHPDPATANAQAREDLENGAAGLSLVFQGAASAHGFGLPPTEDAIGRALERVPLDAVPIELDLGSATTDAAAHLAAVVKRRGVAPAHARIRFGIDPLGAMAVSGTSPFPRQDLHPLLPALVAALDGEGFRGPFAAADGRLVHAAGGSEVEELAFVLAAGVAYLRAFEAGGVSPERARGLLFFRLAADAEQFLTMAKFRALRLLWARVEQACGLAPRPTLVAAETAWRMMSRYDPHVNLVRATVATFAAAVAGADSITVLPFTLALGLPDAFARRLARNTQLILLEESNLAKVGDPAAGSGAVEDLTDQMCRNAWRLFQEIEAAGGLARALETGLIQRSVAEVRARRAAAVAHRTDGLTGVSEFPDLGEAPVTVLRPAAPAGAPRKATAFPPLVPLRLAEPYEALRDAANRILAQTGARPKVFLAVLGRPADFMARATFARNFFAAGGIEAVLEEEGFPDLSALIAAFRASGAAIACMCSSDAIYAREAAATARALAAAGARHVYLAGRPKDEASYRAAGVGTFIYGGCDALATLGAAHDIVTGRHR
jgi:methylmalonyl-CoA mutase